jgi:hypothetical protein
MKNTTKVRLYLRTTFANTVNDRFQNLILLAGTVTSAKRHKWILT